METFLWVRDLVGDLQGDVLWIEAEVDAVLKSEMEQMYQQIR